MADNETGATSIEPDIPPVLHLSAWDFGLMMGMLRWLQQHQVIDQYDLDEMVSFYHKFASQQPGPDRYYIHYRLYDEAMVGKFSMEDRVVQTSYDYRHSIRAEAIEATSRFARNNAIQPVAS